MLVVVGEVDLAVRDELRAGIRQLLADAHSPAYIDLSGVTFFDSTGVHALIDAREAAREHGVELIIEPSERVTMTLNVIGLADHFAWGKPPSGDAADVRRQ